MNQWIKGDRKTDRGQGDRDAHKIQLKDTKYNYRLKVSLYSM